GDTLWKISQEYGVTVEQIKHWNGIQNHRGLQAGESLSVYVAKDRLPNAGAKALADAAIVATGTVGIGAGAAMTKSAETVSYKVEKGDTLWDIARKHNVDPSALMKDNNLSRHSKIR